MSTLSSSLPMLLNEDQQTAITTVNQHVLVLAGAGSGKTRVITAKLFYLIKTMGVPPYAILALTFTNKAAYEMKTRVSELIGGSHRGSSSLVTTFHAFGVRFLRLFLNLFPQRGNDFVICDDSQKKSFLKEIFKQQDYDGQYLKEVSRFISLCKNKLIFSDRKDLAACVEEIFQFKLQVQKQQFINIYRLYEKLLVESNRVDFDDLIVLPLRLMREQESVRDYVQKRWKFLLVDEYQDIDFAQEKIIEQFAKLGILITAVGDDNQSIYGFRGADVANIFAFPEKYPNVRRVILEQNYRSTEAILDLANKVIAKNPKQFKKTLRAALETKGSKPLYQHWPSDTEEATWVAGNIYALRREGVALSDIGVFYRTNYQSRVLEEALLRRQIPYQVVRGFRFYERKEIKEVLAYLSFLLNLRDRPALTACINVPKRAIGDAKIQLIMEFAQAHPERNYLDLLGEEALIEQMPKNAGTSLRAFHETLRAARQSLEENDSLDSIVEKLIQDSGLWKMYAETKDAFERDQRLGSLRQFVHSVRDFLELRGAADNSDEPLTNGLEQLQGYLETISLAGSEQPETDDAVNLLTVHNAKGLEYPIVHVIGMEEAVFPHYLSLGDKKQTEEERRLFYVAVTRAMRGLFLSSAEMKRVRGDIDFFQPSRFLKEIPVSCLSEESSSLKR